jgi:hypothetical protein
MSTCKVHVYIFCGGCGKELDSSCYPGTSTLCSTCQQKKEEPACASYIKLEELTYGELTAEMDEVDDARKQLYRQMRGKEWSAEDQDLLRKMDRWAQRVFNELRKR